MPPRFVPTLTEVVQPGWASALPEKGLLQDASPPDASPPDAVRSPHQLEDQVLHRVMQLVMQRVDLVLERRLAEAVSQLVLTHIQALAPRLREEIELVVRESVSEAIAHELTPSTASD